MAAEDYNSWIEDHWKRVREARERREAEGEYLARLACEHCCVPWEDLMAKTELIGQGRGLPKMGGGVVKTRLIVKVRDLAIRLLRGATPEFSYPEIARILGLKTHATALYSFRRSNNVPLTVEEMEGISGKARLPVFGGSSKSASNQIWAEEAGLVRGFRRGMNEVTNLRGPC